MRHFAALAVVTASIVCTQSQSAQAEGGPEDIAAECAELVNSAIARLNNALADDVQRCVAAIRKHKANGEFAQARRVARQCIKRINKKTRAAHNYVKEVCTRCINALLDLGAFDLAERLRNFCADSLDDVEQSGKRARQAVKSALNS